MTDLAPLLARIEAATGPDRELDEAIAAMFCPNEFVKAKRPFRDGLVGIRPNIAHENGPDWYISECDSPAYTASLDATVALIEQVLPEANCIGFDKRPNGSDAYVSKNYVPGQWYYEGFHPTDICLALLAALVKVKMGAAK